jgi:hypothetical protein
LIDNNDKVQGIISLIQKHTLRETHTDFDFKLILRALNCMQALLEIGLKSVLTTTNAINTIGLTYDLPNDDIRAFAIGLLSSISDIPHVGPGYCAINGGF